MTDKFSEWADTFMPDAGFDHYKAWKAGYQSAQNDIASLRAEIIRLHEIISERNHNMGLG